MGTTQKCGIYRQIVTNIRQIVANIVQKVTIIVQKVINIVQKVINTVQNVTKIVQLHLLLPAFKPVILITWSISTYLLPLPTYFYGIYHISVVFYYSLTQKCGIYELQNVTQNGAQTNYVPQAPHLGHSWGTEYSRAQDGKYLIFYKISLPTI